jgi:malate dehydrogenase
MEGALKGVRMEIEDCSFPLLDHVEISTKPKDGFRNAHYAFLIGARPRGPGMERKDLLLMNAEIFANCGNAMNETADKNIKVVVVGNPANTNCLICAANAKSIPKRNFTALTKLDHNRAKYQVF